MDLEEALAAHTVAQAQAQEASLRLAEALQERVCTPLTGMPPAVAALALRLVESALDDARALHAGDDGKARSAWRAVALRHSVALPDDAGPRLLFLPEAPSPADEDALAAAGLRKVGDPPRSPMWTYAGHVSVAAVAPVVARCRGTLIDTTADTVRDAEARRSRGARRKKKGAKAMAETVADPTTAPATPYRQGVPPRPMAHTDVPRRSEGGQPT